MVGVGGKGGTRFWSARSCWRWGGMTCGYHQIEARDMSGGCSATVAMMHALESQTHPTLLLVNSFR